VDFLVRKHGKDSLVSLVRSYADGVTDDEAFKAGIGQGVAAFQAAWLAKLGAKAPVAVGPQVGPPGPLPAGWAAQPGAPGVPTGPVSTAAPGGPSSTPAGRQPVPTVIGLVLAGFALALSASYVVRTRRRRTGGLP
jgi:hypothetical protein